MGRLDVLPMIERRRRRGGPGRSPGGRGGRWGIGWYLADDGMVGQQLFAGEATRLAYGTDEAVEGRDSFLEKRPPDFSPFPWAF